MVAIRTAVPDATLIVDANESWRAEGLAARCQLLADLGVVMLEQPLPAQDDAALENFIHPLPICADESCHTRSNLKALKGRYEMVNICLLYTSRLRAASVKFAWRYVLNRTIRCYATLRTPPRCIWKLWITPANGCSTCRCWRRTI